MPGAIGSATQMGPQSWETAIGPGDLLHNLVKEIEAFHDAVNKFVADHPVDAAAASYIATKAYQTLQKYSSEIKDGIQKYGQQFVAALSGLANGTLRIVGGVLETAGGDLVPPILDPTTLGGMNNIVASLGGAGSTSAEAFAAGVAGMASTFSGVG